MKKLFILLIALNLHAATAIPAKTRQLLVVSANGFETSQAILQAYERSGDGWEKVRTPLRVNLGKKGLGWGEGLIRFEHAQGEPVKREGDGKSPAGLFSLDHFFGYEEHSFDFAYLKVDTSTLCIDDAASKDYNQILKAKEPYAYKSFEHMKREDRLYGLGIVVGHNKKALEQGGSCIFIHIQKHEGAGTAGCTSMPESSLWELMQWLDEKKHPLLLQVPQDYLDEAFIP